MSRPSRILWGLLLGAAAGVVTNLLIDGGASTRRFVSLVTEPVGRMWLSALIMVVIPLTLSSLAVGVAGLGDLKRLGRVGLATLLSFVILTTIAATIGLTLTNVFRPGSGLDPAVRTELLDAYGGQAKDAMGLSSGGLTMDLLVKIVPRNPVKSAAEGVMLAVIFFALMLGAGLASLPRLWDSRSS